MKSPAMPPARLSSAARPPRSPAPWRRGLLWLLLLGPLFFLSYGFANWLAAERGVVAAVVFDWERHMPFLPWTIVPYWSIDLLYGLSLLTARSVPAVDRLALRLVTAQGIAVACFVLFPLRFSFERPETGGLTGALFDLLAGFDRPYNQAPSLHVALLAILWQHYAGLARGAARPLLHAWFGLIAVSVLTTWQHHFVDLPTGLLLGLFCLWLWPDRAASPLAGVRLSRSPTRQRLALAYLLGAAAVSGMAPGLGGPALWLLWPGTALAGVAAIYAGIGPAGFQKRDGRHSLPVALLLAPYLAGAWLNQRLWTRGRRKAVAVAEGVWLGPLPGAGEMNRGGFASLLDLTAELPAPQGPWRYVNLPWLDLAAPTPAQLTEAARHIEVLRRHGPLLVACALGRGRSAAAVAAWLLITGRAADAAAALARLRALQPGLALGPSHHRALAALAGRP